MDLRLLVSFTTVARLRSFTEAAARLNIVQPAISRQIQQLEEEVGVALLYRTKRVVRTTAAGAVFLERAEEILARSKAAAEEARGAARGEVGRLAIGFLGSATSPFLPGLVQRYRARYPAVKVTVAEMTPTEQMAAFEAGAIDAGFTRPLERHQRPYFHTREVYEDKLVVAMPANDPRALRETIALRDLASDPFVLFERALAPGLMDTAVGACQRAGFSPQIAGESPLMQTVLVMAASGMGVSLVPSCVRHLGVSGVKLLNFTPRSAPIGLVLIWPKEHAKPTVGEFDALVQEERAAIAALMRS